MEELLEWILGKDETRAVATRDDLASIEGILEICRYNYVQHSL